MKTLVLALMLLVLPVVDAGTVYVGAGANVGVTPHEFGADVKKFSIWKTYPLFVQGDGVVTFGNGDSLTPPSPPTNIPLPAPAIDVTAGYDYVRLYCVTDASDNNTLYMGLGINEPVPVMYYSDYGGGPVTNVKAVYPVMRPTITMPAGHKIASESYALLNDGTAVFFHPENSAWPAWQPARPLRWEGPYPTNNNEVIQGIRNMSLTSVSTTTSDQAVMLVLNSGEVYGFGSNASGQLGTGTITGSHPYPMPVKNPEGTGPFTGAIQTANGRNCTLILKDDGTVYGCGLREVVGTNPRSNLLPVKLNISNVTLIYARDNMVSAACKDGSVWAWSPWWATPKQVAQYDAPVEQIAISGDGTLSLVRTGTATPSSISSVTPSEGASYGGEEVTVTGEGFTGLPEVYFGELKATSVVVSNSTTLVCRTPAHGAGQVSVKVLQHGATSAVSPESFVFIAATGPKGDTGDAGPQGSQGLKGDKGDTGAKGDTGDAGPQGSQGLQGLKGDKGDAGAQGLKGDKGPKGDTGAVGPKGETGDRGDDGSYIVTTLNAAEEAPTGNIIQLVEGIQPPTGYVFIGRTQVRIINNMGKRELLIINYYRKE